MITDCEPVMLSGN